MRLFVDHAEIEVRGGKGGDGCLSFRREKYVPKGGPDGGDGGHGGSVFLVAHAGISTLLELAGRHHWRAENGRPGEGGKRSGRTGKDLEVPVPVGTLIYDKNSGRLLKDLTEDQQRVCVARGGRGGKGNTAFVTPTHQAPRETEPGRPGQERMLRLELKLIADVGFVGLPNAGKSTLLSRLTNARPKIADYPFTTKDPQLGICELPGFRRIVMADIPGLIEGAHEGVGLGDAFLRHIERTRVLVHLVDLEPPAGSPAPDDAYHAIRAELQKYSPALAQRREIIVGNKLDLTDADLALELLAEALDANVLGISAATGHGLRELAELIWNVVEEVKHDEEAHSSVPPDRIDFSEHDETLDADDELAKLGREDWDDEDPFATIRDDD